MDVNAIANTATQMSAAQTSQEVQVAVLKKALVAQEQSALQLIEALPAAPKANPEHLGNNVDTSV